MLLGLCFFSIKLFHLVPFYHFHLIKFFLRFIRFHQVSFSFFKSIRSFIIATDGEAIINTIIIPTNYQFFTFDFIINLSILISINHFIFTNSIILFTFIALLTIHKTTFISAANLNFIFAVTMAILLSNCDMNEQANFTSYLFQIHLHVLPIIFLLLKYMLLAIRKAAIFFMD